MVISSTALLACGDDATVSAPATTPAATTTAAPTATQATASTPASSPAPATTPAATTSATTTAAPEQQPGGAGDEEPVRVPAHFTVAGGRVAPETITVPAFLPVEVRVTGAAGAVTLDAPGAGRLPSTDGAAVAQLAGLRPGRYRLTVDGAGSATLKVTPGGEAGP